jgi:hypothetical protein
MGTRRSGESTMSTIDFIIAVINGVVNDTILHQKKFILPER